MQHTLAVIAQKDMQWSKWLKGPRSSEVIKTFNAERDSLLSTVLELFECKEPDIVPWTGESVDFLGMLMSMTPERSYLSMEDYIKNSLIILEWSHLKETKVPIEKAIDGSSKPLSPSEATKFHTAQGMLGWISNTARPDVAFAHSRIDQHQSNLNESSMSAVQCISVFERNSNTLSLR